jgi:membrane-bound lytic murein transglycosylase A
MRFVWFILPAAALGLGCKSEQVAEQRPTAPAAKKDYYRQLPPGAFALRKITDPARIPDFTGGFADRENLAEATRRSITYLADHPSSREFFPSNGIDHGRVLTSLRAFVDTLARANDAAEFNRLVRERFDVYQSVGCDDAGTVLFTGYYRPIFEASTTPTAEYRWPLYRRPPDLATDPRGTPLGRRLPDGRTVSYYTRGELESGDLLKGLELVYLKDRFDAFIIHVQGSALLKLTDGTWLTVGYAGKTDRPYRSIADALVADGKIKREERSLQTLRRHFRENPRDMDVYLPRNESYVFFAPTTGGPYGSLNVPVTPLRTIATDKSIYPRAALAFLSTEIPGSGGRGRLPYTGFALDQDTGGAIRAAGRCDIFMGTGADAEAVAGHTLAEGILYYLFVKDEYAPMYPEPAPSRPVRAPTRLDDRAVRR